jgi:hypothetical protein
MCAFAMLEWFACRSGWSVRSAMADNGVGAEPIQPYALIWKGSCQGVWLAIFGPCVSVAPSGEINRMGQRTISVCSTVDQTDIRDGFVEWREYNGHLYGTPRSFIDESLHAGSNVIMKPGVNGALAIKERYPGAVLIFLLPDNSFQLAAPARSAADRTNEQIAARLDLEIAHQDVKYVRSFDYLIINEQAHPDVTAEDLGFGEQRNRKGS